jgi:cation diffusion facilitator family transporter
MEIESPKNRRADPSGSPEAVAHREKKWVALTSVVAAVFLTGMKLVVGLLTNSLGILSEALHSGLDLVAAAMTYYAVRVSGKPPSREYPYGHGKIENFSAFLETILLLVTCVWIVYEAVERLIAGTRVEVSVWSFVVMALSIAIDATRSRALKRMAVKHGSQALEADALHFSTDIWSSAVVILGLAAVAVGERIEAAGGGADWLFQADAVAALGVSAIVVLVSVRLGRRTVGILLDRASREQIGKIEETVGRLPGISGVKRVRLRQSGPATFVDMTLDVPRSASLEEAHVLATAAEQAVEGLFPRADVVVHIDPVVVDEHSLVEQVWSLAGRHGVGVHGLRAYDVRGRLSLSMHLEVLEGLTVGEAHERATGFEEALRREIPRLNEVVTHIEPIGDKEVLRPATRAGSDEVRRAVTELPRHVSEISDCHNLQILDEGGELSVSFHCTVDPGMPLTQAHRLTVELEAALRSRLPGLGRVVIHLEPPEARDR